MTLLHHAVSSVAQRDPDRVALALGSQRCSYGTLERDSNQIARALRRVGVRPGDRVCLVLPKSPRTIAAIVAVLKAGAIYVPLDPDSPPARLHDQLARCETRWILASAEYRGHISRLSGGAADTYRVGWLDEMDLSAPWDAFDSREILREEAGFFEAEVQAGAPAYILFTSGSTGTPKGVVITHANVSAFLTWAIPHFGIAAGDRLSGHPPLHFDLSVFDIFGALAAAAELHLVPPELNLLPARVVELIARNELTQWFSVPAMLTLVAKFDLLSRTPLPSLRRVLWCGEVLPLPTLRYWMRHLPHARFTNLYGPTETTIASSYYDVPSDLPAEVGAIPIGVPVDGEELLVLDDALGPAPTGVTGNLYIAGAGVSPGYWRDEDKTAEAFPPDRRPGRAGQRLYRTGDLARVGEDGLVYFVGRADTQIKSRGYRIELGEIEAALARDTELKESAVVAVATGGFDGVAICCAFAPLKGAAVTPTQLRERLATILPSYMLPSRWKGLEALPRNANGKVDRPRLEEEFRLNVLGAK